MSNRWHQSWHEGRIGFHRDEVHGDLPAYKERFLGGGTHRVLVPLCGKTLDMPWIASEGHQVVGVELVPQAVDEFVAEQKLDAVEKQVGEFRVVRAGPITIWNGDIFALAPEQVGAIDRIWDRAALVALPKDMRGSYVAKLRSLASPGTLLLQNDFEYDESKKDGPPYSVPDAEFRKHYDGCEIELLEEVDNIDTVPQFRDQGHDYWWVRSYLVGL